MFSIINVNNKFLSEWLWLNQASEYGVSGKKKNIEFVKGATCTNFVESLPNYLHLVSITFSGSVSQ